MLCTCLIGIVVLAWLSDYQVKNSSQYVKFIWPLLTSDQISHYVPGVTIILNIGRYNSWLTIAFMDSYGLNLVKCGNNIIWYHFT